MPFPRVCSSVRRDITENKSSQRAERRGGVLLCSCVCVKNASLPLPWRLQSNKIKGVSVSTPKCESLPPETREERDCKGRMERSVREKCREWRHCGGDRRVIWVRWTEWWYVNKRVTDTKETERASQGGEKSQLCSIWHLCRKHLASLSITRAQLIDFLLFSIRFLRGSCFFSFFVCLTAFLPRLFTSQTLS